MPSGEGAELDRLLVRQHGVIGRRQALRYLGTNAVWRRVASGRWRAAHRGVYVAHTGPVTEQQRLWIAVLAVGCGRPTYLGGLSALSVLGLRRFDSRAIHVLLPASRRDRDPPPGVVVHRTRHLAVEDRVRTANPPCTAPARSVIDAAQWARSDDEARTIIAASFQQRLVSGDEIDGVLGRLPVINRRALIISTVADARTGSETVSELDLLRICRDAGLPLPSRQVFRIDATGRPRYLDAVFDEWNVRIEIDGGQHMFVEEYWRDMERQNDLAIPGEVTLRFPAWKVRERPADVAARIRRALVRAGWRPPSASRR